MPRRIPISRLAKIPDKVRLERYRRAPELGPRILFFSGGSALRDLSKTLKRYTFNSQHLITPFDSGGSSAHLRDVFSMPSIGDLRNRLCALADENLAGNHEIREFFGFRFPVDAEGPGLRQRLTQIQAGRDILIEDIPQPIRNLVSGHLGGFCDNISEDFDLRGASLGNLTLAGAYLLNGRDIDAVCYLYSRLLEVRGFVRATVNAHLDICVELEDGSVRERQHLFTGKQTTSIDSPISKIYLTSRENPRVAVEQMIERAVGHAITEADLICFPMGSFYSSLIANLLPVGVGSSVKRARGPRVFIPNTGHDPEQIGMSVDRCVAVLLATLQQDAGQLSMIQSLVDLVLVDSQNGHYPNGMDIKKIEEQGVTVLDLDLASAGNGDVLDPAKIATTLLSLA
ncbi:MAG: CofD-related protein of GAK system [Planctomycetota bacterium]|jgi:CofD-related protein of GAK system